MSLCLSMIVKDEAHVIQRCLRSVKPFIDSYSISDTGSTDNTMELIRQELEGIPGVLSRDPWQDFATNRNISFARATGDYVFFVDADEVVEHSGEPISIDTEYDGFFVRIENPDGQIWFRRLLRNDRRWKWESKVHEQPVFDGIAKVTKINGLSLRGFFDSHQNLNGNKHIRLLEILEGEPRTPRNLFHIAGALTALGRADEAIAKYYECARIGGQAPEVYVALWMAASVMENDAKISNDPNNTPSFHDVAAAYFRAYIFRTTRYEALVSLCQLFRSKGMLLDCYNLSNVEPEPNDDIMLADPNAIWRIIEEHAIAAYYLGKKDEARKSFEHLLSFDLSAQDRERTMKNLTYF